MVSRAELLENRYQERISVAETKVGLRSLLPNFNINAAFTSSSNDYLQNKSNFEFGSSVGANLLKLGNKDLNPTLVSATDILS